VTLLTAVFAAALDIEPFLGAERTFRVETLARVFAAVDFALAFDEVLSILPALLATAFEGDFLEGICAPKL
jgi:hypothetical protein